MEKLEDRVVGVMVAVAVAVAVAVELNNRIVVGKAVKSAAYNLYDSNCIVRFLRNKRRNR